MQQTSAPWSEFFSRHFRCCRHAVRESLLTVEGALSPHVRSFPISHSRIFVVLNSNDAFSVPKRNGAFSVVFRLWLTFLSTVCVCVCVRVCVSVRFPVGFSDMLATSGGIGRGHVARVSYVSCCSK